LNSLPEYKVSLILTVFNEENTIDELLESIAEQTCPPDELVIIDGGSTDNTVSLINIFLNDITTFKVAFNSVKGVNVPKGRNLAISSAEGPIIAVIDGGCIADKFWLERITRPFQKQPGTDVVAGFYQPHAEGYFQRCEGIITVTGFREAKSNRFLPSSRSIAFRKLCWKQIGGYPEDSAVGEDTIFARRLVASGAKIVREPMALVYWRQRNSLFSFSKQMFRYAQSGVWKRCYVRSIIDISLLLLAIFINFVWIMFLISFTYSVTRLRSRFKKGEWILLPGVIALRWIQEVCEIGGLLMGIISRPKKCSP